jgi:hypothetical protein
MHFPNLMSHGVEAIRLGEDTPSAVWMVGSPAATRLLFDILGDARRLTTDEVIAALISGGNGP